MSRQFTPEVKTALRSGQIVLAGFASFDLRHAVIRLWTGLGRIKFMGCNWLGAGSLVGMSEIEETTEMRATGMEFSLSGIPNTAADGTSLVDYVQFHTKTGGEVETHLALFNPNTLQIIADPKQIFAGSIDTAAISISGSTFSVVIAAEGPLAGMNGHPGQRLNDETQRALYPGDRGFEFVTSVQKSPDSLA